jgi:hypothetical protein
MANQDTAQIENIRQLFSNAVSIQIPPYQRAYSWEDKQVQQFLDDLIEQKGKQYYLGQFLFEKEGDVYYIIDGQQRLTTTVLFLAAISKISEQSNEPNENIRTTYLNGVFKTIEDDHVIFKKITQKHLISSVHDTETLSQRRLINAFIYFENTLRVLPKVDIKEIQSTLELAIISTYFIGNKVEATQVFEYQNNRGKELSRFEVIKAYLMHQIYVKSKNDLEANKAIKEVETNTSKIYRYLEGVEGYFSETDLLDSCCDLFYGISGRYESIKEGLLKENSPVDWIKSFFDNFVDLCHSARSVVSNKQSKEVANLFLVGNETNWKIVLLSMFYKNDVSGEVYSKILKLLEILSFKLKLGNFRTDYLPSYAKAYFETRGQAGLLKLHSDIRNAAENGFQWYWNEDDQFKNIVRHYFQEEKYHYTSRIIKYVLWQYENMLREENKSGALLDKNAFDDYTIEHITPQKPKDFQYTEEFMKNYVQIAGNLALLTQSQNSKFSNRSFEKKRELFQDTALTSYTEIRSNAKWTEEEIKARHLKISEFAIRYFDLLPN